MRDARLDFPATGRNQAAIAAALRDIFPPDATVLELASGSGQHAVAFAAAQPGWTWQPTDLEPAHVASIDAWRAHTGVTNVLPALRLDVLEPWPASLATLGLTAAFCANMIHIAPVTTVTATLSNWARLLPSGAPAVFYGPFRRAGVPTAPSNERFDESLRSRDPRWGVRSLEDVLADAQAAGLHLDCITEMPANNLIVTLRRT